MAQHDYFLENQTAANYRTDHNNCLAAIVSNNSGDTEPSPTFAFQIWVDTSGATDVVKQRNADNDAWIEIYRLTTSAQTIQNLDVSGNITVGGTVDGRDVAADGTKLDGIESGATADQTAAEIRTLVESASDSNVFTDADHTKLDGIETGATADQTAAEIRSLVESASDSNVFTDADHTKLDGIETGATADQTKADIDALNIDAGTLDGIDSGSFLRSDQADTADSAIYFPSTFSAEAATADNIANRVRSGFWQTSTATTGEGWPLTTNGWYHLLSSTHSNTTNYYAMQFAGSFYGSNDIFYRSTAGSGTTAWNKLWHAGNDGDGSGLDADKLDNQHGSYYLDRANHTGTNTTVSSNSFAVTNGGTITDASGNYGSIKVTGGSTGGWKGYAIEDGVVFMQNDANTAFGLYDDTNNKWALYHVKNAATYLYYNGSAKFQTNSTGAQVNGQLSVGSGTGSEDEVRIYKADNNVSDHLQFYNATTRVGEIGCEDTTWLRINQETNKNIYTPRYIRADNGFYIDGTTFGFTGDATLKTKNGTASAPSHTFGNDTNTGVFLVTADQLGFTAGGVRRGKLTGDNVEFPGVYNATTTSGSTVKVNSSGRLRRDSSSRNVKTNIEPMEAAYATKLLNEAQPVWYRPRIPDPEYPQQYLDSLEQNESPSIYECEAFCLDNDIDWEVGDKWMNEGENPNHSHWGFIAEDLAEVDPRLCYLNPDTNTWDSVDYEKFTPVLLKLAQMQKEEIAQTNSLLQTALTRIEALEAKVAALESGAS